MPRQFVRLTIMGVPVRVVCGARWLRFLGADGLTLGHAIFLRPDAPDVRPALLAHEYCHVLQWRARGGVVFCWQYAWGLVRHGYGLAHPLERNAYDYAVVHQAQFGQWVALLASGA